MELTEEVSVAATMAPNSGEWGNFRSLGQFRVDDVVGEGR
jgi:hypothetical protein